MAFVSLIEPKNLKEAIIDEHWIIVMLKELNQFERNKVFVIHDAFVRPEFNAYKFP